MEIKVLKEDCPCTKNCVRHGDCQACRKHHEAKDNDPACER